MAAGSSVLQYTALYCGWKACRRQGCIAIQPGVLWQETELLVSQGRQLCRDTARGSRLGAGPTRRRWAGRAGTGAQAAGTQGAGARGEHRRQADAGQARNRGARQAGTRQTGGTGVRGRAAWAAWARCWPGGCALDALGLFSTQFDSLLFLSQFLDIVREPG